MVAGVVPWWITGWPITGWRRPAIGPLEILGGILIVAAVAVLLESFARFAWKGLGTPAPVFPTRHLVVSGLYRFVRNPMYVAVVSAIFGQALLFASLPLAAYGTMVWVLSHAFVVWYEEPTLHKTFGAEYESFRAHVPRWIPRFSPWTE